MTAIPRTAYTNAVFRWEIPVDDQWHEVAVDTILHVATRDSDVVEVWFLGDTDRPGRTRRLRVFGTGHPLPAGLVYVGTAIAPGGMLVWHLFEDPTGDAQ